MWRITALLVCTLCTLFTADSRGPQLTHLDSTSASIVVHVDEKIQLSLLYHDDSKTVHTINNAEHKHQPFNLSNLTPDTQYTYRIVGTNFNVGPYQFTTPPLFEQELTFCAYGHSRRQNITDELHKNILKQMMKEKPDFLIHTGNVFGGGVRANPSYFARDWTYNFFKPLEDILPLVPFYLSPGQHDVNFIGGKDTLDAAFPHMAGQLVYTVERGPVAIAFLCIPQRLSESIKQLELIEAAFQRMSFAKWRFVCMHVPPHGVGLRDWILEGREELWHLFRQYRIDVVVSGRQQNYQRLFPARVQNGDHHAITVISTSLGMDSIRGRNRMFLKGNDRDLHYVRFHCDAEKIDIQAINIEGRVIDRTLIDKQFYSLYLNSAKTINLSD